MFTKGVFCVSLSIVAGCTNVCAQNAYDFFNLFAGVTQSLMVQTTLAEWKKLSQNEINCVDQTLRQRGSSLQTVILQGVAPSDPRIANVRASCRSSIVQDNSSDTSIYFVANTRPPDAYLSLRTNPTSSVGQRITTMPNGTLLRVLQRQDDGWWFVKVVPSGPEGWALSHLGDRTFIECCTTTAAGNQATQSQQLLWDHNGSKVYLVAQGLSRKFLYKEPRPGMLSAGAKPGSIVFDGRINREKYEGTAYLYNGRCGPQSYPVEGPILDNYRRVELLGLAPRLDNNCRSTGYVEDHLVFQLIEPNTGVVSNDNEVTQRNSSEVEDTKRVGGEATQNKSAEAEAIKRVADEEAKRKAAPHTDCDDWAGDPDDPQRLGPAVPFANIPADQAVPACEAAIRQYPNEARLIYQLGRSYQRAGNPASIDQYRKAADQEYAPAQWTLGLLYASPFPSQGVSQDYNQAVVWYRKAAEQGFAPAQNNLGVMYYNGNSGYRNGQGVSQDNTQAAAWFQKAAEQGNAAAQNNLGNMYQNGQLSRDSAQANAWHRKAAEQEQRDNLAKQQGIADVKARLTKIAEKNAEDAQKRGAEFALEAKRDPNDVVAQVLNYSSFGNDEGSETVYWYQDKSDKCRYKLFLQGSSQPMRVIDLNALDPRSITFQIQPWSGCTMNCNQVNIQPDSPYVPVYGSGVNTIIQHDADVLFKTRGQLNLERLQRGWTLIYSKYCKGKKKPF